MSDARTVSQLSMALGFSVGSWWLKLISGVTHDVQTSGVRNGLVGDDILRGVSVRGVVGRADAMRQERYGITRDPNAENVLVVDFQHFRTVRDVRRKLYGDRRSPLASDQGVKS